MFAKSVAPLAKSNSSKFKTMHVTIEDTGRKRAESRLSLDSNGPIAEQSFEQFDAVSPTVKPGGYQHMM